MSHSVLISGGAEMIEPLEQLTGFTLGDHAVNVFFVISGFLVTKSLINKKDLASYVSSRILRIVPGLFVMALLSAFVLGAALTTLPMEIYLSSQDTWGYAPLIGTLGKDPLDLTLPGLFVSNPFPDMVNGPLWTLRYEALAYITLAVAAAVGIYTNIRRFSGFMVMFLFIFIGYSFWNPIPETRSSLDHLMRFFFAFSLGCWFYMLRGRIILNTKILLGLFVLMLGLSATPVYHAALLVFTAYACFWFAFIPAGAIRRFNNLGDYSYGIYIYGWPLAQIIIFILPELSAPAVFILGFGLTLPVAAASWHVIEKPALSLRFAMAALLRKGKRQPV